jgi:two-component system C4-dicarboxylate transport response regulator DctD
MSTLNDPHSLTSSKVGDTYQIGLEQRGLGCVAIVDDDLGIAEAIADWLDFEGISHRVFDSAEAMLESLITKDNRIEIARPDTESRQPLIGAIIDINLPGQNGLVLSESLRQIAPSLPIVIISAMRLNDINKFGALPTHIPFLSKPFELAALENALLSL